MEKNTIFTRNVPARTSTGVTQPLLEIKKLHAEICAAARTSLDKAVRIGELLAQIKSELKHGDWLPWLKANVKFSQQTASNYVRIFDERDKIKLLSVSNLTDAYRLLAEPEPPAVPPWAKSAYPLEIVKDALEITAIAAFICTKRGAEPTQEELVEALFCQMEAAQGRPRVRIDEQGHGEHFNDGEWQPISEGTPA